MGYHANFGLVDAPIFDERGYPRHVRGVTPAPGLYFLGPPWLYTWGSGRFSGVERDADYVVQQVAARAAEGAREGRAGVVHAHVG